MNDFGEYHDKKMRRIAEVYGVIGRRILQQEPSSAVLGESLL